MIRIASPEFQNYILKNNGDENELAIAVCILSRLLYMKDSAKAVELLDKYLPSIFTKINSGLREKLYISYYDLVGALFQLHFEYIRTKYNTLEIVEKVVRLYNKEFSEDFVYTMTIILETFKLYKPGKVVFTFLLFSIFPGIFSIDTFPRSVVKEDIGNVKRYQSL